MKVRAEALAAAVGEVGDETEVGHSSDVRGVERLAAHFVSGDGRERGVVLLARANADDALDRLHEDLAVADGAGACALDDRVDRGLHEWLGADHLDLDLVLELEHHGATPIVLETILLAAMAARAAQG